MAGIDSVDLRNPSETTDTLWIEVDSPRIPDSESVGKWLIFRGLKNIDKTWGQVRKMIRSGQLKASKAVVATKGNCENSAKQDVKVIKVRTSEEHRDEVGLKLIHLVSDYQNSIRYKLDSATNAGLFTHKGHGKVTCAECQWNDGNPRIVET